MDDAHDTTDRDDWHDDDDLGQLIFDAWKRLEPRLENDPAEVARRMARRTSKRMHRPPRAWCLAVRAADTRVEGACVDWPEKLRPRDPVGRGLGFGDGHRIYFDKATLQRLCAPVTITKPGEAWYEVAQKLGVNWGGLRAVRIKGVLRTKHVQGLAGRRGPPTPVLYAAGELDPSNTQSFAMQDAAWGPGWSPLTLANSLPGNYGATLTRVPAWRARGGDVMRRADAPSAEAGEVRVHKSRGRLPLPGPDETCWYKWKGDEYIGYDWRNPRQAARHKKYEHQRALARAADKARRLRNPPPSKSQGSQQFIGWKWVCPTCGDRVNVLYLPVWPPYVLAHPSSHGLPGRLARRAEDDDRPRHWACCRCHGVVFFSRLKNNAWDHLVAHLSDGLLYGSEVTRPRWLTRDRKRPFRPQLNRAPSAKRAHVLERLVAGWAYADIAREMNITVRGMRKHVHQIMRQHGVHSRAALHRALGAAPPPPPPTRWRRAATADAVRCR